MASIKTRIVLSVALLLLFCFGLWTSSSVSAGGGGNRCTDHCADAYKVKKDVCKLIPFKNKRKRIANTGAGDESGALAGP